MDFLSGVKRVAVDGSPIKELEYSPWSWVSRQEVVLDSEHVIAGHPDLTGRLFLAPRRGTSGSLLFSVEDEDRCYWVASSAHGLFTDTFDAFGQRACKTDADSPSAFAAWATTRAAGDLSAATLRKRGRAVKRASARAAKQRRRCMTAGTQGTRHAFDVSA